MAWTCPHCGVPNPELWRPLVVIHDNLGQPLPEPRKQLSALVKGVGRLSDDALQATAELFWATCQNMECREIVVVVRYGHAPPTEPDKWLPNAEMWYAIPKKRSPRKIDPLVGDPYRRDYLEAALILEDSPRMSSVLSRRVLADLLEDFAGLTDYLLEDRIDKFLEDSRFPANRKENLHHLRDIANFAAHRKKNKRTGAIIEVDRKEAEWTLTVVDGLFDLFIVGPAREKERREQWDEKRGQVGSPRQSRKRKNK